MKKAYLTIDDAPSADFSEKVGYLKDRNIPTLFFCIGENIEKRYSEMITAIQAGFHIGNHSYSHRHFSDLNMAEAAKEISDTDQLIEALYSDAGRVRPGNYFRFPYFDTGGHASGIEYEDHWNLPPDQMNSYTNGERRTWIQNFLAQLHYEQPNFQGINLKYFADKSLLEERDVRCTYDQAEYYLGNPQAPWGLSEEKAILSRIDEDYPFEGRSLCCDDTSDIILVHDHEHTTDLFYKIIDKYLEKGISFQVIQ